MRAKHRLLVGAIALIAVLALASWRASRAPAGPPVAVVEPPERHVDAEEGQEEVQASYRIWNRGGSDLLLGKPSTTCGCTVASIRPTTVAPGRSATIKVVGRPPGAGTILVQISVPTNSVVEPELSMTLTMSREGRLPYVAYATEAVRFGAIREGAESDLIRIETREASGSEPWLANPLCTMVGVVVDGGMDMERAFGEGVVYRRYEYRAKVASLPARHGEQAGEIVWSSGPSSAPAYRLPISGVFRPPVFPSPSMLYVTLREGEAAPSLRLLLRADDPNFALQADPDPDQATPFTIRRSDGTAPGRVAFAIEPTRESRPGKFTLRFRTNSPGAAIVEVPVILGANRRPG